MDRTPQSIVADVVAPLGQHMLEKTADALVGGQGHGPPALVLRVLGAEAHLAILDREAAVVGQRDAVVRPAQVVQDWPSTSHGRLAVDHPSIGPNRLGKSQVGGSLTPQSEQPSAKPLREGMDGDEGGRAGGPPLGSVGGASPAGTRPCTCGWSASGSFTAAGSIVRRSLWPLPARI